MSLIRLIAMDLTVLYNLSYGMYVLGAFHDGHPAGCVINTCFQVTSEKPLLAISLNKNNFTLEAIRQNNRFSLSIIDENTDPAVIGTFGFHSSRDTDKYAAFGYELIDYVPCVKGDFAGRLILEAEQFVDCETHVVVIARLTDTVAGAGIPMTYAYYHKIIKGKAPSNAPTYQPQAAPQAKKNTYRCDICGYEVEVDGELPADYECPLCGADRSHFKKE